jgi:hypothetical protein
MKLMFWVHPSDLTTLHDQIENYDETKDPIKLHTSQVGINWYGVTLDYSTFRWMKECNAIIIF